MVKALKKKSPGTHHKILDTAISNNPEPKLNSLNPHLKSLVKIAALTAVGDIENLKKSLHNGLDAGLTINEIKESLVQLYAYCGFPRSLNAINTLMVVLEERKGKNILDETGKDASPIIDADSKYDTGKQTLQKLTGRQETVLAGANAFAPAIDKFLKEHLFADIFSRDVLDYLQREFVTIAALASMTGVHPQLQAHINMGLNVGATREQLTEVFCIVEKRISKKNAIIANEILVQVVSERESKKS